MNASYTPTGSAGSYVETHNLPVPRVAKMALVFFSRLS
jgi:hypothetical protein